MTGSRRFRRTIFFAATFVVAGFLAMVALQTNRAQAADIPDGGGGALTGTWIDKATIRLNGVAGSPLFRDSEPDDKTWEFTYEAGGLQVCKAVMNFDYDPYTPTGGKSVKVTTDENYEGGPCSLKLSNKLINLHSRENRDRGEGEAADLSGRWLSGDRIRITGLPGNPVFTDSNPGDDKWNFKPDDSSTCRGELWFDVDPESSGGGQSAWISIEESNQCYEIDKKLVPLEISEEALEDGIGGEGEGEGAAVDESCEAQLESRVAWLVCPVSDGIRAMVDQLDTWIAQLATLDTSMVFGGSGANPDERRSANAFHSAWSSFRTIALGLIVIVSLIVIVATAFGLEVLDAYTIRKAMPRVLLAVIFIALSWQILEFLVTLSNDVGNGVRALMYAPFAEEFGEAQLRGGSLILGSLAVTGAVFAMGPMALLSFAITAALAVLVAFLVLIVRELIVMVLVILAPIGIAMLILPNTQKYWQLWQNTLTVMLVAFPIIAAIIAAGRIFSVVTFNNGQATGIMEIIAFLAYILPYFMLPFAFRMAGGAMGALAGMANNADRGAFDRLKKYRQGKTSQNFHDMKTGNRMKGSSRLASGVNATTAGMANLPSAGFNPKRMRSRFQSGAATKSAVEMAEYMDKDAAFGAIKGNDDYLQATMKNMGGGDTEADWRRYLEGEGYEGRGLEQGVAQIRAAKRATSNEVFEKAAVMANAGTGTGWKKGGAPEMMESINAVAGDDRHTAATMLAQMRSSAGQAGRLDIAGAGFGTSVGQLNRMYDEQKSTGRVSEGTKADVKHVLSKNILETKGTSDFARARGQAINQIAPEMLYDIQQAHNKVASTAGDDQLRAQRELAQKYASVANFHDSLNHMSPENAKLVADNVLSQEVEGQTVMAHIEGYRQARDPDYIHTRKDYDARQYREQPGPVDEQ